MKRMILLILIAFGGYILSLKHMATQQEIRWKKEKKAMILSSPVFFQCISGEFKGIISDFMLMEGAIYLGSKKGPTEFSSLEWTYLYYIFETARTLDPYFRDPYWLVQSFFTWWAKKPEDAIDFLKKGLPYRTWDWRLPYYIGFDYFYFLKDNISASEYLLKGAKIPGSPFILATLGARLASKAGQTEAAIAFLKDMYEKTEGKLAKNMIKMRLEALRGVLILEEAIKKYEIIFGHSPIKLTELVEKGIIKEIPPNPYGTPYYLKEGKVRFD